MKRINRQAEINPDPIGSCVTLVKSASSNRTAVEVLPKRYRDFW
ncbi:hypothetical protein [Undibacterium sp. Jales W-56]|nr:hypothetical protein [Undibacterium sp. Jales W-56]